MSILKEWKINSELTNENHNLRKRIEELENEIGLMNKHYKTGPIHIYLLNEIKKKDKELFILNREFEKLKEWSHRIRELEQKTASELAWVKFRYFNLINDNRITEMNLVGAEKSYNFAINRFEQIRKENEILKQKLKLYEEQN
jgi:hypothetical protein